MRDIVTAHSYFYFKTRSSAVTENFDNLRDRLTSLAGVFNNLSNDELSVFCATRMLIRNQNLMTHSLAIWNQNPKSIFTVVTTHYLLEATLKYLNDSAFAPATVIETRMPRKHLITVE